MSFALPLAPGSKAAQPLFDYGLMLCVSALIGLGLVMVASASMPLADRTFGDPLHYLGRHALAIGLAVTGGYAAYWVPIRWWQQARGALFLCGLALLVLVLIPGIGHTANGATRWIPLGPFKLQSSELMKLFAIVYVSGYLVRHREAVMTGLGGFVRPLLLMSLVAVLIMAQPDFGTMAVILATALGLLFLGGVRARYFLTVIVLVSLVFAALVYLEPYRWQRVIAFLSPFDHAFDSGYQLTQSLIAFGRGEWLGVGLGNGIQKQFFLPEPHTDFIAAVIGEELGLVGILGLIAAFAFITARAFGVGARATAEGDIFGGFLAYGIGISIGLQAFVNLGVSLGVLPTKGLTLPFVSYGSNSLILACVSIGILLRIDRDWRRRAIAAGPQKGARWVRV